MVNSLVSIKLWLPRKALLILSVILLVILPMICWNLQYSALFIQGDFNYAGHLKRLENNRRVSKATFYINKKFPNATVHYNYHSLPKSTDKVLYPMVVFLIIAANKNNRKIDFYQPFYLSQTIHTLLLSIDNDQRLYGNRFLNISVAICSVDNDRVNFHEFNYLSRYFDHFQVDKNLSLKNEPCNAKVHYLSCLHQLSSKYRLWKYTVVMEDDLLAVSETPKVIAHILTVLATNFGVDIQKKLAFVQLFHPINEVKYSILDPYSYLEVLALSLALVFIFVIGYFRRHIRKGFLLHNVVLLSLLMLIAVGVVLTIGRPHWLSLYHKLGINYRIGGLSSTSTAALLLPRAFIDELTAPGIDYKCVGGGTTFDMMRKLAVDGRRSMLSVNVNLFRHIGLYSTFKNVQLNPHYVD